MQVAMVRGLLLLVFFCLLSRGAGAGTLSLTDNAVDYTVGSYLQWYQDSSLSLDVTDVLIKPDSQWQQSQERIPNLGYSEHAVWFRAQVKNHSQLHHWQLLIDYPLIRSLDVFYVLDGVVIGAIQAGDRFEFSARPSSHRNFIFPLELHRNQSVDIYFRISGPYAVQMPVRIMSQDALLSYDVIATFLHGLFFGFVVVMACYNFFLFISTREISYFYYVLFTLSIGGFQFVQQGFAYQFLWPKEVWLQNKATGAFIHFSIISCFLFVASFLEFKKNIPLFYKLNLAIAAAALFLLVTMPWVDEFWIMRIGVLLSLPATLLAIFGSWYVWRLGRRDARIFSIAWGIFLSGVMMLSLNKLGFLPRNFYTEHGAEIGTVVELALLAFALADRINQERKKRMALEGHTRELERGALASKEKALELEKMNSEQLELSVRERTRDLHRALSELSIMNRRLEQMNLVDTVTSLGNENCFISTLAKEWDRACRGNTMISLMVIELDSYREIIVNYGDVAGEECLKNVAGILERLITRPSDVIARYGDKVFGVILPTTDEQGAQYLAEQVVKAVGDQPFDFGAAQVQASVSVGIACVLPQNPDSSEVLVEQAESAVYVAKNNGGNRIQCSGREKAAN